MAATRRHAVLTVAGLDSSGGAGITADAAVVTTLGPDVAVACTAVTAQSDAGVVAAHPVLPEVVAAQMRAAFEVHDVRAVKTGMLVGRPTIEAVADTLADLRRHGHGAPLVVDPVLLATAGGCLLADDAVQTLIDRLLPLAHAVTPNLGEAARLAGMPDLAGVEDARRAARRIHAHGVQVVVITGGHSTGRSAVDLVFDGAAFHEVPGRREPGTAHGTGCVYSAAFAVYLAQGMAPERAAAGAKHMALLRLRGEI